ncbi:unnamed protein product [Candidula unifasciata]|uniref:UDP-glucuronosyltransferase n=1 Tax=Candidula unifasciata TaxID=100452 RepID=A0A8S3ZRX2_9EUPU|nr:unnamed protein product [Candidula unifasciata]
MIASTLRLLAAAAILATILPVDSKKVVFYPAPTASYVIYHSNIASSMSSLGHDVWICLPRYLVVKNLVKDPAIKIVEYGKDLGDMVAKLLISTGLLDNFWDGKQSEGLMYLYKIFQEYMKISAAIMSDESFLEQVRNIQADLFVLDSTGPSISMIVLPYKLGIPYALVGTMHDVIVARVPFSPAATPPFPRPGFSDQMSFSQRLQATILSAVLMTFEICYDSNLVSTFVPEKPYISITNLAAKAEIFIAELDHILDYPRPMLPNTKLIGGSSASAAKPLAAEFQKFVNESKHGIVVVSFGSAVVDIPPVISEKMTAAFNQLDQRVVWRVNITSPEPNHIMTSKWIPQNDLLGQEKTRLFVSHCGKNGQYEALYHGVPILCLPIYGDQFYNAERIRIKEFGLSADVRSVSADQLADLMKQIINESKYTGNMKKASRLYRELYKVSMKEAAFWLDHVMTYGGNYMRSSSQKMPLYQFMLLDVLSVILGFSCLLLVLLFFLVKLCCRCCRRKGNNAKVKQS